MSKNNHYDPEPITSIIKACGDAGVVEFSLGDLHISFGKTQRQSAQKDMSTNSPAVGSSQENYDYPTPPTPMEKVVPLRSEDTQQNDFELLQEELRLSELKLTDPYAYELKQLEDATHGDAIQ